ncbi:hypothetical protein FOPG_18660 [Fusarium oxysporum f. sp. conglutinans race 2 54008]|uniref:Uncharacterized protein n=1 Tax=Fusarium oxysporum f. sp. conglutinans race 2 54008 TaxID=1089457 RepID=X0HVA3_FUSOX|nr:hypothetical protein FOPG_18660 [Fusarium oxysporum f. sp. conglutinans race 2 54008]
MPPRSRWEWVSDPPTTHYRLSPRNSRTSEVAKHCKIYYHPLWESRS